MPDRLSLAAPSGCVPVPALGPRRGRWRRQAELTLSLLDGQLQREPAARHRTPDAQQHLQVLGRVAALAPARPVRREQVVPRRDWELNLRAGALGLYAFDSWPVETEPPLLALLGHPVRSTP
jgi:hypothetical protein